MVSLFGIGVSFAVLHWIGTRSTTFARDLASGVYHEVVGDLRITLQPRAHRLFLNGRPFPLHLDRSAMLTILVDCPSSIPGATVRYLSTSKWLLEIETAEGQIVYRDPKLEAASRP